MCRRPWDCRSRTPCFLIRSVPGIPVAFISTWSVPCSDTLPCAVSESNRLAAVPLICMTMFDPAASVKPPERPFVFTRLRMPASCLPSSSKPTSSVPPELTCTSPILICRVTGMCSGPVSERPLVIDDNSRRGDVLTDLEVDPIV